MVKISEDFYMENQDLEDADDVNVNDMYATGTDIDVNDDFTMGGGEIKDCLQIKGDSSGNLLLEGGVDAVVIGSTIYGGSVEDLYVSDDFDVAGSKNCVVHATDGHTYNFSVIESPEIWFEEKLSGAIFEGLSQIDLDKRFIASTVIDENHPLHVIATPTSEGSLWVEKFFDKVIVHGDCTTFDITISAKRLNYEDVRFDEMIYDEDLETIYKKRKGDLFLEQKPKRLILKEKSNLIKNKKNEINDNKKDKVKRKKLKEEYKVLKSEVKTISSEINELYKNYKIQGGKNDRRQNFH